MEKLSILIPEAGPLGETFSEASALAIVDALFLKRPSSGWVESVSTFADHFFVVILPSGVFFLRKMRGEGLLSSALEKKVAEHGAALFGEEAGDYFDFVIQLGMVHDGEDAAARSGLGVVGGVDEAGDSGWGGGSGRHCAGLQCAI